MNDRERFERLLEVLDELAEANERVPIVVEGKRDVASLRRVGCRGHIHPLHRGDPLFTVAEEVARREREVILLTDWDRKGGVLFEALESAFAANGVKVDRAFRDKLQFWMRPPVKDVESLAGYVQRGLEVFHRKDLADHRHARDG